MIPQHLRTIGIDELAKILALEPRTIQRRLTEMPDRLPTPIRATSGQPVRWRVDVVDEWVKAQESATYIGLRERCRKTAIGAKRISKMTPEERVARGFQAA
ncbi:helix-turn-helix transcriptional regulator [Gimibacter soli]|uniref:Uncharacterized protein n=1 Tax=Gimibacter soli TaxID=3024400 RepID=A0AAE9XVA5_9PROT|nr:hypothetical protein [Gimibacter soli]WCL54423.1 hypothetical protein PH603_01450 [Gimibacter soli]